MTPDGPASETIDRAPDVEQEPVTRGTRARDASARAADWTWALIRRIHLGTRKPENWVQVFKFGVVGGTGYVVNLIVFALLIQELGVYHLLAAVASFCV